MKPCQIDACCHHTFRETLPALGHAPSVQAITKSRNEDHHYFSTAIFRPIDLFLPPTSLIVGKTRFILLNQRTACKARVVMRRFDHVV
jgi:hypothetical protein